MRFTTPRRIESSDMLDGFDCGITLIDEWLSTRSRSAEKQGTAVAYVTYAESGELEFIFQVTVSRLQNWLKHF